MFRVIIADDENRIVKMLAASIPWTKLGLSVASFASDGMEALRLAEEKNHANHFQERACQRAFHF